MLRVISWNIAHRDESWRALRAMKDVDVALLQEASPPPSDVADAFEVDTSDPWNTVGAGVRRPWRAVVVRLSDRVTMQTIKLRSISEAAYHEPAVSRPGTLAVAEVTVTSTGEKILLASLYAAWERSAGASHETAWNFADSSAHRLLSDLAAFIPTERGHRIIAAGDLNVLRGYGENGNKYWGARYQTIFDRAEALGLPCLGPELAAGVSPQRPRPAEAPPDSRTVPTFRKRSTAPESATRQLDFVFASRALGSRMRVSALDGDEEWGPSDHCRVEIVLESRAR